MLPPVISRVSLMHLGSEDHPAEAVQGETKVNAADHRHGDELRPDDGKIGTAIQNGLREGDKMWGRADDPHHVLQPDRHALHWRGAAGQKLHDEEHGSREQWNCPMVVAIVPSRMPSAATVRV